jgi:hypothetical protein
MLGKFKKSLRFSFEFLTLAFLYIPETNNGAPSETKSLLIHSPMKIEWNEESRRVKNLFVSDPEPLLVQGS